jgi:precorrin-2 dehydrogenase/sirohydrochlorin ferrochelatase
MRYYPIGLDISGRRCLVIGGGEVGERKAQRLLECGARVSVVGRELTPALAGLARGGRIDHIPGDYDKGLLEGAVLVIGATDDRVVNERIFRDARRRGVLANIVDDPDHCDFILPALCRQGDLVITVATGGKSPALAKKLRQELEERYGPEYKTLLKIMGELRGKIIDRGEGSDENRKLFETLVDSDILEQIRKGKWKKVEKIVKDMTGVAIDLRSMEESGFGIRASGRIGNNAGRKRPGGKKQAISKNTKSTKKVRPARP